MRGPLVLVGAVAVLSIAAVTGSSDPALAGDGVTLPTLPPLPSISVSPLPVPAPSVSLPVPVPSPPTVPAPGPGGGGGTGGSGAPAVPGAGGTSTPPAGAVAGPAASAPSTGQPAQRSPRRAAATTRRAGQQRHRVVPMVAGRPEAADVVDDESSPALVRAGRAFLRADRRIAALARLRDAMATARGQAAAAATTYRDLGVDIANARAQARELHARHDLLRRTLLADVRRSYQTGRPVADDLTIRDLAQSAGRAEDAAARAELRVGELLGQQSHSRATFEGYAATYDTARDRLARINAQLQALADQRAAALAAARQAAPVELARQRQTVAESGQLGAQIRAASAALRAEGRTVQGSGQFLRPSSGVVTSPYGMRFHPILRYTKLHTGTDFAVGDGYAHAADDGRVLFTIVSQAYGNFTVIDHGTIDGRHITTAYAHQAQFLVRPGDVVRKGQPIGLIGSTGYATGPHLHFEVRDDGAVEDPMPWLT